MPAVQKDERLVVVDPPATGKRLRGRASGETAICQRALPASASMRSVMAQPKRRSIGLISIFARSRSGERCSPAIRPSADSQFIRVLEELVDADTPRASAMIPIPSGRFADILYRQAAIYLRRCGSQSDRFERTAYDVPVAKPAYAPALRGDPPERYHGKIGLIIESSN